MKNKTQINKYIEKELIDDSLKITTEIIEDDLDYNNIIGSNLVAEKVENYLTLFEKKDNRYIQYLDELLMDYSELFFVSDIEGKCLYFECLIGSRTDPKKLYLKRALIYKIRTDKCPLCSSYLKIKPLGNIPVKINGKTEVCERYIIYCNNCNGDFGTIGFRAISILKGLFFETKRFIRTLKKIEIGKTSVGIEWETNFDTIFRCGH